MTTPGVSGAAVSALHLYPVKSLHGVSPDQAVVEPWGLAGDRRWMLVDTRTQKAVTQREDPRLALLAAEPVGGGGVRVHAPGRDPLDVAVPPPGPLETVGLFAGERVPAKDVIPYVVAQVIGGVAAGAVLYLISFLYLDCIGSCQHIEPISAKCTKFCESTDCGL